MEKFEEAEGKIVKFLSLINLKVVLTFWAQTTVQNFMTIYL